MADIFVTVKVNAKDKLEGTAKIKSCIKDRLDCEIVNITTDNSYEE